MAEPDIQLFKPFYRVEDCLSALREALTSGWTGLGGKTLEFERLWCEYMRIPRAHFVNSATAALQLAVRILKDDGGWQDGDEVITTPLTFVSTNHVLLHERLAPVFADVDLRSHCLSLESVRNLIGPRTRAVMYVGFGGSPHNLEEIWKLCSEHKLKLIVDASHMTGTRIYGVHIAGAVPDVSIFSFHSVKNLPTADGGMVCFTDASHDAKARRLSWLGIDKSTYERSVGGTGYAWMYGCPELGYKCHGNSIMAVIGIAGLRFIDHDNAYRRQLAVWYRQILVDELAIAESSFEEERPGGRPFVFVDHSLPGAPVESSRHLIQIRAPSGQRNRLMDHLKTRGIFAGVHYRLNTDYPMYAGARRDGTLSNATLVAETVISLPNHLAVRRADVERICCAIKAFAP